eukprot:m.148383 g.148383  ORF g.148383 m.148383 type:complete len:95 (+) comp15055_c23_seq12:40-324(+)
MKKGWAALAIATTFVLLHCSEAIPHIKATAGGTIVAQVDDNGDFIVKLGSASNLSITTIVSNIAQTQATLAQTRADLAATVGGTIGSDCFLTGV